MNRHETIKNKAVLLYNCCGKTHAIESNEVEACKVALRVIKEQDCNIVFAGDKICYKVIVCNDSNIDLYDLDFRDRLDSDVKYDWNTFRVNGELKKVEMIGHNVCYHINKINAGEEMVITFDVKVE